MEQEPKFERQKEVPWDESIIPPDKREWLRELNNNHEAQKEFWETGRWSEDPKEQLFLNRLMRAGSKRVIEEYNIFYMRAKIMEIRDRLAKAAESHGFDKDFFRQNLLNNSAEELRIVFEEEVKFYKENGVPEERLDLGRFIAEGYKWEAKILEERGINPENHYPMEESTDEILREAIREESRNVGETEAQSAPTLDIKEPVFSGEEKRMARQGERLLKEELLFKPFEIRYQELKKERKK